MSLDGQSGVSVTAELNGGGRTTLLTDPPGLTWQLLKIDLVTPITLPSPTGITRVNDKYLVSFLRPSPSGQYVLRWAVPGFGNIDEQFTTFATIPGTLSYVPTVDDIGALLRTRTKDTLGVEIGTFNADTRPTGNEVVNLIGQAYDDVTGYVDTDIPEAAWRTAKSTIALRAAMLVELSYWPEQIPSGQSPYEQLRILYEGEDGEGGMLQRLVRTISREVEEEATGELPEAAGQAYYGFGNDVMIGLRTIW